MSRPDRKVVMIGLDGVSWPLIERWAADGELPNLQRLIDQGVRGRLRTPEGCNDNAVWSSIATARRPERHGWQQYSRVRPGGYAVERVHRDHVDGVSFWQRASDAGCTVTVLDVPKSPLGQGLRGVELVDWDTHGADSRHPLSVPPEFADEVVRRRGRAHPWDCLRGDRRGEELALWIDERLASTRLKGDLVLEQLERRDADLVVVAFSAGHCIGHQCWHVHDPGHTCHDPQEADRLGDPVLAAYRALDHELGRILEAVDEEATVMAFTGLGMGTNYSASGALDGVLARADVQVPSAETAPGDRALRLWRRLIPQRVRAAMPEIWHRASRDREARCRARRSFFAVDIGSRSGGIRLNLAGREAKGVITPEEADAVMDQLEALLCDLTDGDTGEPIVAEVERTADTRIGPYAGDLPDLMVHWTVRPGAPTSVQSPELGSIPADPPNRTGHHHADGFFVARGPDLPAGVVSEDAEVVDLGPTVAGWLGFDLPAVDGRPLPITADPSPHPG